MQDRLNKTEETTLSSTQAAFRHSRAIQEWILTQNVNKLTITRLDGRIVGINDSKISLSFLTVTCSKCANSK